MSISINLAHPEHLDRICQITDQAKARLRDMGVNQWQTGYPSRPVWEDDIRKGQAYVAQDDNGVVLGQFVYLEEPEPSYETIEGAWLSDTPYACIHRVAVANEAAGKGIAALMFMAAFDMARESGFSSVRIDTHEDNQPMQRALAKAGFERCGIIHLKDGSENGAPRIAFERML